MNRHGHSNSTGLSAAVIAAGLMLCGCATQLENSLIQQHTETERSLYSPPAAGGETITFSTQSEFKDYLLYSFENSPKLRAAFERWKASLERIPQARSLEDPELTFEYMLQQYEKKYQFGLMQKIPLFGELGLQTQIAAAEAEAAMHAFENARFMLYDRVADLFYHYAYLGQETAITEQNVKLLTDLEQVAETQVKDGSMTYSELIQIQIEKEKMVTRLESLRDQRQAESTELAATIHLNTTEPLPWPTVEPSADSFLDEALFLTMLEDLNPELKEVDARVAAREYREQLARRNQLPDFAAGVGLQTMANDNQEVAVKVGLSIPLWLGKNRAAIREAEADTRAAKQTRQDLQNRLRAELSVAVFQAKDAQRRITLYKNSLIPKAEQALTVAQQDFTNGKIDLKQLIHAQQVLLEFQLTEQRAIADREIALTEIGCCIGRFELHTPDGGSEL